MNISPSAPTLSTPTVVNPPTESLRRENSQREIITQVTATNPSAAEKGVASEKDRAKTPAQTNEQLDFTSLRKQAEEAATKIAGRNGERHEQNSENKESGAEQQSNTSAQQEDKAVIEDTESQAAEEQIIRQLANRDQEVRTHEQAHASVGGSTTGAPSYSFDVGPDGKKYAVSGEVSVDLSVVSGDPQATIKKMQQVHAAALAPTNPSSQDIKVAASATKIILEAQSEILSNKGQETQSNSNKQNINNANSKLHDDSITPDNTQDDFDTLINQTLNAQEAIAPEGSTLAGNYNGNTQTLEVQQRAERVGNFYHTISEGYERPNRFQFQITA
jgi:hypothetical protein